MAPVSEITLTATRHVTRQLRLEEAARQRAAGQRAWRAIPTLPINDWLILSPWSSSAASAARSVFVIVSTP